VESILLRTQKLKVKHYNSRKVEGELFSQKLEATTCEHRNEGAIRFVLEKTTFRYDFLVEIQSHILAFVFLISHNELKVQPKEALCVVALLSSPLGLHWNATNFPVSCVF
jgi:hypothetical protein